MVWIAAKFSPYLFGLLYLTLIGFINGINSHKTPLSIIYYIILGFSSTKNITNNKDNSCLSISGWFRFNFIISPSFV